MKKLLLIICLLFCTQLISQNIITKDGFIIGDRNDFVSACGESAKNAMINISGIKVEVYKYCECMADKLIPEVASKELIEMTKSGFTKLFETKKYKEILLKCIKSSDFEMSFDSSTKSLFAEKAILECTKAIISDDEPNEVFTNTEAEEYCKCAIDKMFSNAYDLEEILQAEDENSPAYNEIVLPCVKEVMFEKIENSNLNKSGDVTGIDSKISVPLIDDFNNGYKVKVSIDGVSKYFLIDTGASDLIIDSDLERELLLNGTLKKDSYLGEKPYTLANNDVVVAQMVILKNIKIGDYTVNNVKAAVINNASLLCGISFLSKFSNWMIDPKNSKLILMK